MFEDAKHCADNGLPGTTPLGAENLDPCHLSALGLDDTTAAYVVEAQSAFGILCQVVSQLAGMMVLDATEARSSAMDHPMFARATELFEEAEQEIRALRPSHRAAHHHHHLTQVIESVRLALVAVERRRVLRADRNDPLDMLREAWREIVNASKALPGFEPIDLSQSCCAVHIRLRQAAVSQRLEQ